MTIMRKKNTVLSIPLIYFGNIFWFIFYNIIKYDTETLKWISCDTYIARTRKRDDGVMGDFVKYYDEIIANIHKHNCKADIYIL